MHAATISPSRIVLKGSLAQNKVRGILSVLAIALGVALGYAVQLITGSAVNELALGVRALAGDADLQVRGPRVEVDAKLADRDDVLRIIGLDAFRAAAVEPALVAETADRFDAIHPDRLFLTPAAARWLAVDKGDTLTFQVALRDESLRVGGFVRASGQL